MWLILIWLAHLNGCNICVLRRVLVVVEAILGHLSLSQIDTELNEEQHDGLQGGDGAVSGALRGDMLVKDGQGGLLLPDSDEFLGSLYSGQRLELAVFTSTGIRRDSTPMSRSGESDEKDLP